MYLCVSSLIVSYQLDSTVLTSDRLNRTASNVTQSPLTFTPLQIHEGFLSRGDIVAIDAEFVTLNQVSHSKTINILNFYAYIAVSRYYG